MLQAGAVWYNLGMDQPSDAKVLILTDRPELAQRWAEMLAPSGVTIWRQPSETPVGELPDVVLTDASPAADTQIHCPTAAILRIGSSGPADAHLPADLSARELRLACRLLAQVARLRRRETQRAELCRRLHEDALTDPLTGLPNRRAWNEVLPERLASLAQRLCVALFDLDHFKRINDAHGHAAGDEMLRASGRAIADALRQGDFVARLGGDEFGLLLAVPDAPTAAKVVERVRAGIPSRLVEATMHRVSASAGYHVWPDGVKPCPPARAEELYVAADAALRRAKQQGRDRTVGG